MTLHPLNLLILGGPCERASGVNAGYRGTYRWHPSFVGDLPEDHEVNQLFCWFLEDGGESGIVHDLDKAIRFVELLNIHGGGRCFEVIQAIRDTGLPWPGGTFIGFDLSLRYSTSLLPSLWMDVTERTPLSPVLVLADVVHRYYAPFLNQAGLFDSDEVASSCLRAMEALQQLHPCLYEGEDLANFSVTSIYAI